MLFSFADAPKEEKHDVKYFRNLLCSETDRLHSLCDDWRKNSTDTAIVENEDGMYIFIKNDFGKLVASP